MGINIGKYNQRVIVQGFTTSQSASGAVTRAYSTLYTLWAEVVPTGGSESDQSDEKVASRVAIFRIRKQGVSINEKMRIIWNNQVFDISSIDEFGIGLKVGYEIRGISKDSQE